MYSDLLELGPYPYVGLPDPHVAPRHFRSRNPFGLCGARLLDYRGIGLARPQGDPNRTPYHRHAVSCHRHWDAGDDLAKPILATLADGQVYGADVV